MHSLRTDPASGTTYGAAYESEASAPAGRRLEVWYFTDGLGPQVSVRCRWGEKLMGGGCGVLVIARAEWDKMLAELRP